MKLNYLIRRFILSTLLCLLVIGVWAQPGDPSSDPDVPITGIEILIALGGVLGLKKFISTRKNSQKL